MTAARLTSLTALVALFTLGNSPAFAHPLGNFSISHYTRLELRADVIELHYVVDMAEIPTFQEIQGTGLVPEDAHPTVAPYLARKADSLKDGLVLAVGGHRLPLQTISKAIIFPPGVGGLPTLKLAVRYRATLGRSGRDVDIDYRDNNFAGRAGWKEIIAVAGIGVELVGSSVPARDRSRELGDYPTDLLDSPPQTTQAYVVARRRDVPPATALTLPPPPAPARNRDTSAPNQDSPAPKVHGAISKGGTGTPELRGATPPHSGAIALMPNPQAAPSGGVADIIATPQLGVGIVLFALLAASGLGAFHALEPGHGKTLVAAYLVGSRGTAWHALVLGLVVTASHTAGVYLLGGVTLYASRYIVPERLYPWLGVASGLMIAGLGLALFLRRFTGDSDAHDHQHTHHDAHGAGGHAHPEGESHHPHHRAHHHHHEIGGDVSLRALFALGVSGGIVPCPAALVVLLSAVSLNRVAFGLVLIVAFSLGLAAVLVGIGLLIVYARRFMIRFEGDGPLIRRYLPLTSAAVMTGLGVIITAQALRMT